MGVSRQPVEKSKSLTLSKFHPLTSHPLKVPKSHPLASFVIVLSNYYPAIESLERKGELRVMALKYYLLPFPLGEEKDQYRAVPKHGRTLYMDELIQRMLDRGSLATKTDILAIVTLLNEVILSELKAGNKVITPLFAAGLRLEGTFTSSTERLNRKKHKVHAQLQAGPQLEKALKTVTLQRTEKRPQMAGITSIKNPFNEEYNTAKPGDGLYLHGHYFYMDRTDPKQGLWLKSKDHLYPIERIGNIQPSTIFLLLPLEMAPGLYTIEFRGCSRRGIPIPHTSSYPGLVIL